MRALLVLAAAALMFPAAVAAANGSWPSGGHDITNSHSNADETKLNPDNVGKLAPKWVAQVHGDVSAIPAVVGGAVYVPDWGGYLNKLDAATGAVIWSRPISDYDGIPGSVSRASPAVAGNTVYLGDQNFGHLMAVNATSGDSIWTTQVSDQAFAILTAGPVVHNGVVRRRGNPANRPDRQRYPRTVRDVRDGPSRGDRPVDRAADP